MPRTLVTADHAIVDGKLHGPTAILIEEGIILAVGPPGAVVDKDAVAIDWSDRVVVPGTVNSHNHSFQSLLRGLGDDLPFLEWREKALYRFSPRLGPDGLHVGALFAFAEMLLHGVTTVCDFFYINDAGNENADAVIEAAHRLGIRLVLARCFYDWDGAPAPYRETVGQAVSHFQALHTRHRADPRRMVTIHPAPHSLHGASRDMIVAAAGCAAELGTPLHIHLAEERYQVDEALRVHGQRPLQAVEGLGILRPGLVAIHGCWFDERERALLHERGGSLVVCPGSNMFLGDGTTDVVDLLRRGVRVGLGTDGGCSNSRVSVFDEMRTCALLQKVHRLDGQAIDAETCFDLGTRRGGQLLDLPVGRIAPGFRADLCGLDLADPSLWPVQAIVKNVVYSQSARAVCDVMIDGEVVVDSRRLVCVALEEIRERVSELTRDWRRE